VQNSNRKRTFFQPVRTAVVPVFPDESYTDAYDTALAIAQRVVLVGIVPVPDEASISGAAAQARVVRQRMLEIAADVAITAHPRVSVSVTPWVELVEAVRMLRPDLLLLDMGSHLDALGVTADDVLANTPCSLALLRGPLRGVPDDFEVKAMAARRILLAVRGGPNADLAVRLGLSFPDATHTALHVRPTAPQGNDDAPFRGLQRVLPQLHDVELQVEVTDDAASHIIAAAADYDLVILGAPILPQADMDSVGGVADRLLRETQTPVLVVKSPHGNQYLTNAQPDDDELAGQGAISILVDTWFAENTFHAEEFANLLWLVERKQEQNLTISLALPALNEEAMVGKVIRTVQRALMEQVPLLDEIVLIDSNSTDRTREIAASLGVPVHIHQQLLPEAGARRGKGEALWKSLLVTKGDIVAWIDTDIANIAPRFVYGILGPLIVNPNLHYVKGFYQRPIFAAGALQAAGGGRVTELMARPLINLFYPELSGVIQPLSGEYAGRRSALESVPFYSGYGVETGLLIEIYERYGLGAIAQVDLLERVHHNQPLEALSKMSFAILQVVIDKLEQRMGTNLLADVNKSMKLIRQGPAGYSLDVAEIVERERPPIITFDRYQKSRAEQR
jgi:glucosyl-3-phosphoglycerate synthase